MAEDEVLLERRGRVLVALLNRPHKRNAINRALSDKLLAAAATLDDDPALSVGVLASATPGMFCAGADLAAMAAGELTNPGGEPRRSFTKLVRAKPWIAAVSGPVLGGGFEMALACEMIVAAERTQFGLPEPRRGLIAAGGGVFRLPRAAPKAAAMEMLLTGRPIDAARAYELGIVNRVVPEADILAAALEIAESVAACAPGAVAETLAIARKAGDLPEELLWPIARETLGRLLETPDAREGMAAFLERRSAVWRDQ